MVRDRVASLNAQKSITKVRNYFDELNDLFALILITLYVNELANLSHKYNSMAIKILGYW